MTPELQSYYADHKQIWRNLTFISISNMGWSIGPSMFMPLMTLSLYDMGMDEQMQGVLGMVNSWLVGFLVMYFSWSSDHTVSRIGRRKIYLILAAPFIIIPSIVFPWLSGYGLFTCLVVVAVKMLFSDLKACTFPLLNIDCMPREFIARSIALLGIISGFAGFLVNRWGVQGLSEWHSWAPYLVGSIVMIITTIMALFIREPPIYNATREPFKPWSALVVGLKQPLNIIIYFGCASIHTFTTVWATWAFLFATRSLNLDWKIVLAATSWSFLVSLGISYPLGWIIDRFGGLKLVILFWVLQVPLFIFAMECTTVTHLVWMSILLTFVNPLYNNADIMVYRSAPPEDIGSVISTNSFFRNLYVGGVAAATGLLITSTGKNYHAAFIFGIVMSTLGMLLYVVHHLVMRRYAKAVSLQVPAQFTEGSAS